MQRRLLDINPEGRLFREIKDIQEELYIIALIKTQQQTVAKTFLKHVKQILNKTMPRTPLLGPIPDGSHRAALDATYWLVRDAAHRPTVQPEEPAEWTWTKQYATDLLEDMQNQLAELDYLKEAADHTASGVGILINQQMHH